MNIESLRHGALLRASLVVYLATAAPLIAQPAADSGYDLTATTEIRGTVVKASAVPGGDLVLQIAAPDPNGQPRLLALALAVDLDCHDGGWRRKLTGTRKGARS